MNSNSDDADLSLNPQQAVRVIGEQTAATVETIGYNDRRAYLVWGSVYVLGYLPLALSVGPGAALALPRASALLFFYACIGAGIGYTVLASARMWRGLRGTSQVRGRMYAWSWWLAFVAAFGIAHRVDAAAVDNLNAGMLINGAFMLVVGCLFMAGGTAWIDAPQFVIGALVCVMVAVALVIGLPAYYWVMSLGVGGLLLVAACSPRAAQRALRHWLVGRHG